MSQSPRAKSSLLKANLGEPNDVLEILLSGVLKGTIGDKVYDFFTDEIENNARAVWSGLTYNPDDEDNVDEQYPIYIFCYEGVYYISALEYDPIGYFLSKEDAHSCIEFNWQNVKVD